MLTSTLTYGCGIAACAFAVWYVLSGRRYGNGSNKFLSSATTAAATSARSPFSLSSAATTSRSSLRAPLKHSATQLWARLPPNHTEGLTKLSALSSDEGNDFVGGGGSDEPEGLQANQVFGGVAIASGVASTALAYQWMATYLKGGAAAGLDWSDTAGKLWNYHPLLMTVAFVLLGPLAMLSYRLGPFDKQTNKAIHFGVQTAAVGTSSAALYAVLAQHEAGKTSDFAFTHGWIGLICFGLYVANYLLAGISFNPSPQPPVEQRKKVMPVHVITGVFLLAAIFAAVTSGTAEKMAFMKTCASAPRGWGWADLSTECKVGNGLAVTTTITMLSTFAALMMPSHESTAAAAQAEAEVERMRDERDRLLDEVARLRDGSGGPTSL